MDVCAAGILSGRSALQHDDLEAMTRAVSMIVHEGLNVEQAMTESGR